jgi:hypothetical protein
LADETALAAKRAAAADKFSARKRHLRALLTGENYHWPQDSPFVRIPKSVAKSLEPYRAVRPPGVLTQEARELLGLTPEEREQVEAALQAHFVAMDKLIEVGIYETNALSPYAARFGIPSGATASQVWTIPALGDDVDAQAKALETSLQHALGSERWGMVQAQMGIVGTDTLRRVLGLDAGQNPQQVALWITDQNGKPTVGYGWQGNGGAFTQDGAPLEVFKPGAQSASDPDPARFIGGRTLPTALTTRMLAWLQGQAAAMPQMETTK